jgi:hypothetical protein
MKWILRYLRELVTWSFTRWRIHHAIIGVIAIVGGLVSKNWFIIHPQFIPVYLLIWLAILTIVVAPACLWRQMDERLRLLTQLRPWVIIDGYEGVYREDAQTGEEYLVEMLHIVNRGDASAVSIAIPAIQSLRRSARILEPIPTLGPGESTDVRINNLRYVLLEEINKREAKIIGQPWSVRIPFTIEYRDLKNNRWTTDHAITFNTIGISISIVHPNEPQE